MVILMASFGGRPGVAQSPPAPLPSAPPSAPVAGVDFVTQTPWVPVGGNFTVTVRFKAPQTDNTPDALLGNAPSDAGGFEIETTTFPSVASRTAFVESLSGRGLRTPIAPSVRAPVTDWPVDANGDRVLRLAVPPVARNGVYPVRVDLRDRTTNAVIDRFVTHMLYLPEPNLGPRLAVALVLPVHQPPRLGPDGKRKLTDPQTSVSDGQALQVAASIPLTVAPTPETVAAMVASGGDAGAPLTALRQIATQGGIVAGPYVSLDLPGVVAGGLTPEFALQMKQGADTLAEALRSTPDSTTWVAAEALDAASVDLLAKRGVARVIATEADLTPTGDRLLTLTRPFQLEGESASIPAVAADPGLGSYFTDTTNPALAAAHLVGDLAVLHFDQPGDRRGAVAMAPRSWQASRAFLDLVVASLVANPILEAVGVPTLFASVTPESVNTAGVAHNAAAATRPSILVRHPVVGPVAAHPELARELSLARRRLASLELVLGEGSVVAADLRERLLVVQSADFTASRQRDPYLTGVRRTIDAQLDGVEMPKDRLITLTARRGEIPVTFRNRTGHPVKLAVRLESDKLQFPGGSRQFLELTRLNTTQRFPVLARTSGAFPIRITLESPDGLLIAGRATLTVRSTAAPGLGLGISIGAALFLALWWGRHFVKHDLPRRRATPDLGGVTQARRRRRTVQNDAEPEEMPD